MHPFAVKACLFLFFVVVAVVVVVVFYTLSAYGVFFKQRKHLFELSKKSLRAMRYFLTFI